VEPGRTSKGEIAVSIPVLRKDFIIDERQITESFALGADAVLLIAAVLKERLPVFVDLTCEYGLEPLVEVHTRSEVEIALSSNAELIGINNRNLSTLRIDQSTTRLLSESVRSAGKTVVSESGIMTGDDIREMKPYCDAFLIGSSIMAHDRPEKKLEEFVCA
jgi:indole-3-glycerol phosphate synthase